MKRDASKPAERMSVADDADEEFEFYNEFTLESVRELVHAITNELKDKATDIEYLMLPFRAEQSNEKLLKFLNRVFPLGNGEPVKGSRQLKIITSTDPFTLFQVLKYIWCRLPNGEVIGWDSYNDFKRQEKQAGFPQKAFLEIMPKCLGSSNHASIVYDFLDLIMTMTANSKTNKMSPRKISKMCALWAFSFNTKEIKCFEDGLKQWIPASDAMFHLLLSFIRSFVPKDIENSKLPRVLKSLLFKNEYPPYNENENHAVNDTVLTIPLVTLETEQYSRKPWQLIERCNDLFDSNNQEMFQAREDYVLLKSLFKQKNNVEGISRKMSQESRRLMKLMTTKHSTFQAGWPNTKHMAQTTNDTLSAERIDIDDYYIWTWLSSLSYEETRDKKKTFHRSVILEFEFDGFKKWVIFQETPPREKPQEIEYPKTREEGDEALVATPSEVVIATPSAPVNTSEYHTVISKEALQNNINNNNISNLHALEQKISKWNPLSNLRKKSNDSIESNSTVISKEKKKKKEKKKYELPEIVTGEDDFKIELPNLDAVNYMDEGLGQGGDTDVSDNGKRTFKKTPPPPPPPPQDLITKQAEPAAGQAEPITKPADAKVTMAELNGMVDEMMPTDRTEREETFESLTKFDQYKPSQMNKAPQTNKTVHNNIQQQQQTAMQPQPLLPRPVQQPMLQPVRNTPSPEHYYTARRQSPTNITYQPAPLQPQPPINAYQQQYAPAPMPIPAPAVGGMRQPNMYARQNGPSPSPTSTSPSPAAPYHQQQPAHRYTGGQVPGLVPPTQQQQQQQQPCLPPSQPPHHYGSPQSYYHYQQQPQQRSPVPQAQPQNRLRGANATRKQGQKKLLNDIRSGNFGI